MFFLLSASLSPGFDQFLQTLVVGPLSMVLWAGAVVVNTWIIGIIVLLRIVVCRS